MTYCVALRVDAGLVFLSDSRTNAGVDQVGTFRKMNVFENPGDRMLVLMTAGNLSISQSIRQIMSEHTSATGRSVWTAKNMYEAAQIVGEAIRTVYERDAKMLEEFDINFNVSMIFGGQIKGETCRLFQMYSAGNFIESCDESTYFQVGESKYGKPVLDRMLTPATPIDEAAKCALVSMDSTLKSNLSVGLPLDLLAYQVDRLQTQQIVCIDEHNPYFEMIRGTWGHKLRQVFESIEDPQWGDGATTTPLCVTSPRYEPMKKITNPGEKNV